MNNFKLNQKFRRDYNKLFRKDPMTANAFLLLCELADKRGRLKTNEEELTILMIARFEDPEEYQL